MSSTRKRAAIRKAQQEVAGLKSRLSIVEVERNIWKAGAEELDRRCKAKQAQIDSLMLEYCPDEMTEEQKENWAKHQVRVEDPKITL